VTPLKRNFIANVAGQTWAALMAVALVPIYIKFLGLEAYGLLSLYVLLQAGFSLLDLGLGSAIVRQVAQWPASSSPATLRSLVKTMEWVYWPTALGVALLGAALAAPAAHYWVNPKDITQPQVLQAFVLMALVVAAQWPSALYGAGLGGLQQHVLANAVGIVFSTLRGVGVIAALWLIEPSIEVFLFFQLSVSITQTLVLRWLLWRQIPGNEQATFSSAMLKKTAGFASGIGASAMLSFALMQSDRIVLSKVLSLDLFGKYAVASMVATSLLRIVAPIYGTFYPRFSQLIATHQTESMAQLYHRACQVMAVCIVPPAAVLAVFGFDVLSLWTRNEALSRYAAPILSLLVVGYVLNGLLNLPYAAQLAHGNTRLSLWQACFAVLLFVPSAWWFGQAYGGMGVAAAWLVLNIVLLCVGVPIMHRTILRGHMRKWFVDDTLIPVGTALITAFALRLVLPPMTSGWRGLGQLLFVSLAVLASTALSAHYTRNAMVNFVKRINLMR
jgi:O-antigen/teichoic acid export membrane protein